MATNLLEMLTETLGSQFAKQASEFLGESESTTKSALGLALPVLLGGLAINPATIYSTVRRHRRWISPENTIAPDGVASELT
jgi:hypothetical protein